LYFSHFHRRFFSFKNFDLTTTTTLTIDLVATFVVEVASEVVAAEAVLARRRRLEPWQTVPAVGAEVPLPECPKKNKDEI
jgi:hypothetical protein